MVAPVALPDEPGLPPRFAPPEGILGRAGAGWVLATLAPAAYDDAAPVAVPDVEVVLLVDPEGTASSCRAGTPSLTHRRGRGVSWSSSPSTC